MSTVTATDMFTANFDGDVDVDVKFDVDVDGGRYVDSNREGVGDGIFEVTDNIGSPAMIFIL